VQQGLLAVNVKGRAEGLGEFGDGNIVAVEGSVAVAEVVHEGVAFVGGEERRLERPTAAAA
jgi:hypothetical protein